MGCSPSSPAETTDAPKLRPENLQDEGLLRTNQEKESFRKLQNEHSEVLNKRPADPVESSDGEVHGKAKLIPATTAITNSSSQASNSRTPQKAVKGIVGERQTFDEHPSSTYEFPARMIQQHTLELKELETITEAFNANSNLHNRGTFAASANPHEYLRQLCCALVLSRRVYDMYEPTFGSVETEYDRLVAKYPFFSPSSWIGHSLAPSESLEQFCIVDFGSFVVLAVRGSKNKYDWMQNVDFLLEADPNEKKRNPDNEFQFHRGFRESTTHVPFQSLAEACKRAGKMLVVTGHSKGGAVAECMARILAIRKYTHVRCISWGAPHIMKQSEESKRNVKHHNRLDISIFRYRFVNDPVPFVLDVLDFTETGSIIDLPNDPPVAPKKRTNKSAADKKQQQQEEEDSESSDSDGGFFSSLVDIAEDVGNEIVAEVKKAAVKTKKDLETLLGKCNTHAMDRYAHTLCDCFYRKRKKGQKRPSRVQDWSKGTITKDNAIRLFEPNRGLDEDTAAIYIDGDDISVDIASHGGVKYASTAVGHVGVRVQEAHYDARHIVFETRVSDDGEPRLHVHAILEGASRNIKAGDQAKVELMDCMGNAFIFNAKVAAEKRVKLSLV